MTAIAALALTGCGSSSDDSSSSAKPSTATAAKAASAAEQRAAQAAALGTKAGKQASGGKRATAAPVKTIAFLNYTSQAVALRRVATGEKAAAEALGWKFDTCDAQGSPPKVATCASSFIQRGDDVISSTAIPVALDTPQLKLAKQKGIPWLNTGGQAPRSDLYAAAFFLPEVKLYGALHDAMFKQLGDQPARIGALKLTVDDTARARFEALTADLGKHPGAKVVASLEGTPSNPAAVSPGIVAMLRQHPDINAIWSCCDILTPPIVQGIHRVGLTGDKAPVVVAPFPDQGMLQSIRDGDISVAVDLPWEAYGWIAVDEAVQNTVHKTPFTAYGEPTQYPAALYGGQIITKDNVQKDPNKLQDPVFDYASYFRAKWKAQFGAGESS
ncbi:sugar ABC transporter substrate-binding protein [Baekduia alba]|uniref:sugar ABC transporter substrate-binding protein n=1 Tax=Baekduia alba TaxID=2997333 RepID=UPI0023421264|nr:substrate-binding domain-containing protein [Baekduia alba]